MVRSIEDRYPRVVREETCSLSAVQRVSAMLDQDPAQWSDGDPLPRGWQFILLGAHAPRSAMREDGFPGLGLLLPDLGLPRLLLGGRTVRYDGDIHIGSTLRRRSQIQKVQRKDTAAGTIGIVDVSHELLAPHSPSPVLVETQTYILLGAQTTTAKRKEPSQDTPQLSKIIVPDEILLFQYSALGFNSHRIHFDRRFACEKEGFPDLVVNGGLATLLLTEFLRSELSGRITSIAARHESPLFCGRPVLLGADRQDDGWLLRAFDEDRRLAVSIQARV